MFLAQGGQPVDVRVQLRLGAQSVIARRPRARQRLIGILEHALGLAVARVQQRAALGGHALEHLSPSPAASSPDRRVSASRRWPWAWPAGALSDWPSPCWIHSSPGMPACSGLLCPRPGKSKPNSAASAFSAASPSRRSAPPSISSSQRASQELLFQHVVTPRVAERQLHAGPCAGFARRQIGDRLGAVALEKGGADGRRHGALAGLVGADKQVQPGLQAVQRQGLAELAEFFQDDARQLHCAPPSAAASLHPQQQPQRLGGNGGLRLVARRGLHRLQLRRDLGHVAAGASCAKSASSGSSSRPEKSEQRARARPPRPQRVAAAPSRACRHGRPAPASARPRRAARPTVGQRLGIGRQAQRLAPGRPAVAAQGHALDLRRRARASDAHVQHIARLIAPEAILLGRARIPATLVHPQAAVPVAQRQIVQRAQRGPPR